MPLTDEQDAIAGSRASILKANAFAGTGKTTTLVEYARRRPNERLTYVAYNRSIKEDAKGKFGSNVRCVTTHGLAYPTFGTKYSEKLGQPRAYHLANHLGLDIVAAGKVLQTVTNFMVSADEKINEEHAIAAGPKVEPKDVGYLIDYANESWSAMKNLGNPAVPMPHDGYLKLYQLSKPVIKTGTLLVDEFQDINPVTLDFINKQRCNKVYVGDEFQSIYGFRGAVNALAMVEAEETKFLTKSFRFGHGIASIASEILSDWRGCGLKIQGLGAHDTVFNQVDRMAPHAILARTNGGLFEEAVFVLKSGKPFGFCGGVDSYRFDTILDTYYLFAGQNYSIKDVFIQSFASFDEMKLYGEELNDREVISLVKVVGTYASAIPDLISQIKARAVPKLTGNEVVLSTTHKAKGLEWMDVVLTNDFTELDVKYDEKGREVYPEAEEINILYVAVTRAMRGLALPEAVIDWLARTGRNELLHGIVKNPRQAQAGQAQKPEISEALQGWGVKMGDYFGRMRAGYQNHPQNAQFVAEFLENEAKKFRNLHNG